jgi:ribose 5-phosphate isomerase A
LSDREAQKRAAAERAVELVQSGMRLGLGTGSTARHVVDVIGERLARGELQDIVGVATSIATEQQARALQIPIRTLDDVKQLDLGIDGADEVDPQLNLIKGLGGALLWEKIVASACKQFVVVGDDTKLVERLGSKAPLPVEVVAFGWSSHLDAFAALGAHPTLRTKPDGSAFWTDGGHYIIDCAFANGIDNAYELEAELKSRAGVVETGLFLDMTSQVIVADPAGTRTLSR